MIRVGRIGEIQKNPSFFALRRFVKTWFSLQTVMKYFRPKPAAAPAADEASRAGFSAFERLLTYRPTDSFNPSEAVFVKWSGTLDPLEEVNRFSLY